ncbi:truncated integrase [Yersinia pestis biovar Antiqua str. UG05-0454]|nr:truncated integrase [Yersinia pestis biovar Antiqua str. UG05-0454]
MTTKGINGCLPWIVVHYITLYVTNGAIVIHTQRLKSDPGGNLLS